jgi:nitrogenase-associated protein
MATIVFYEKPGCATNARQRQMLRAAGHEVVVRDLLAEPWTAARLLEFFAHLPVASWINRASPRIKSGEIDPSALTAQGALDLLLADPLLIRRPLLEVGSLRIAGMDATTLQTLSVPLPDPVRSVQDCSRLPIPHRPRT